MIETEMRNPLYLAAIGLILIAAVLWVTLEEAETSPTGPVEASSSVAYQEARLSNPRSLEEEQVGVFQSAFIDRQKYVPVEALPVCKLFKAVKDRDIGQLKQLYSPKRQAIIEQEGWENYLDQFILLCEHYQLSLDPNEYSISFIGGAESGVVRLRPKKGKDAEIEVVKIEGIWVIDER